MLSSPIDRSQVLSMFPKQIELAFATSVVDRTQNSDMRLETELWATEASKHQSVGRVGVEDRVSDRRPTLFVWVRTAIAPSF